MELRTPLLLVSRVRHCKQLYPVAVCVNESISTYQLTCDKVSLYCGIYGVRFNIHTYMYVCIFSVGMSVLHVCTYVPVKNDQWYINLQHCYTPTC